MSTPFLTFQKFSDPDLATAIGEQLAAAGIDYIVENEALHYDPVLIANIPAPTVHLKIPATEFTRAHAVLEGYYENQLQDVEPDYYLLTFTDAELQEILTRPDEWGHFDYVLARKLLKERGHAITDAYTAELKAQRLEELARYEDRAMPGPRIMSGYLMATHRKVLPDGRQVHGYSPALRKRGRYAFILAVIAAVSLLLMKLLYLRGV